jgi:hypothetical protein
MKISMITRKTGRNKKVGREEKMLNKEKWRKNGGTNKEKKEWRNMFQITELHGVTLRTM